MPRFEPFAGLRYDPERVRLAEVVAPPYDVISPDEQRALQARSPYNSVRIELPDAPAGADPYQAAAQRIAAWEAEGILRREEAPSLYGYRMSYVDAAGRDRETVGVIGALGLSPSGAAGIFPHERTTPKAKSDRLQLLQATRVNTSPIWGLSLAKGLSDLLVPRPDVDQGVTDADGVHHELWPIADPDAISQITGAVSGAALVIADGHHRFETALTYRSAIRAKAPTVSDAAIAASDSVMALVVELADEQLSVQGIHRLVSGLPPDLDLVAALAPSFVVTPTDPPDATLLDRMAGAGALEIGRASCRERV